MDFNRNHFSGRMLIRTFIDALQSFLNHHPFENVFDLKFTRNHFRVTANQGNLYLVRRERAFPWSDNATDSAAESAHLEKQNFKGRAFAGSARERAP